MKYSINIQFFSENTWVLNSTINISSQQSYVINFESNNGVQYNLLNLYCTSNLSQLIYENTISGDSIYAWDSRYGWVNKECKTINFKDSINASLLSWLKLNGNIKVIPGIVYKHQLDNIGNAIRSLTNETDKILLSNIPDEILNKLQKKSSGTKEINTNGTYNIKEFEFIEVNTPTNPLLAMSDEEMELYRTNLKYNNMFIEFKGTNSENNYITNNIYKLIDNNYYLYANKLYGTVSKSDVLKGKKFYSTSVENIQEGEVLVYLGDYKDN